MSLRIMIVGFILGLVTVAHAKPFQTQRIYLDLDRNDYVAIVGNSRDYTKAQIDACLTVDRDLYDLMDPESRVALGLKANPTSKSYEELDHFYGLMNCEKVLKFSAVAIFKKMQKFKAEIDLLNQRSLQGEMIRIERPRFPGDKRHLYIEERIFQRTDR